MRARGFLRRHGAWVNLAAVFGLLILASLVPPDGSLAEIRARGVLRVCAPAQGLAVIEAARIQAVADAIPARLSVANLASIGADANPRNWRVTRAQCDVIAGGLADTAATRSFLTVVPIGVRTGWAVWPGPMADCKTAAVWPGTSGLSRVGLSSFLRAQGVAARLMPDLDAALEATATTGADCTIAPLPDLAAKLSANQTATLLAVPGAEPTDLGLGFWKGDATLARLARKIVSHIAE